MRLTEEQEKIQRVVCAAIRHERTGETICAPRHHHCIFILTNDGADEDLPCDNWEEGFVDNFNSFLTRKGAWIVAKRHGQIVRRVGGDGKELFSENLY